MTLSAFDYAQAAAFIKYVPVEELLHLRAVLSAHFALDAYTFSYESANEMLTDMAAAARHADFDLEYRLFIDLLCSDLRNALHSLSADERHLIHSSAEPAPLAGRLHLLMNQQLRLHNIQIPGAAISVVNQFPPPFTDRPYHALTLDEGDALAHDVEPGVYLISKAFSPIFSQPLILHEYIHVVLGARDPLLLCRGLEEGICELIGSLYVARHAIGRLPALHCFIYSRLRSSQPAIWSYYLQMARQAYIIYCRHGFRGLWQILSSGRGLLKQVESMLWAGQVDTLPLARGDFDDAFSHDLEWLFNVVARQSALSPGAYTILPGAIVGATVREIARQYRLPAVYVSEKLDELAGYMRLVGLRNDKSVIAFSDAAKTFGKYELKYTLPALPPV